MLRPIKVAFAVNALDGCAYYRSLVPGRHLNDEKDFLVRFVFKPSDPAIDRADVLVLHRQSNPERIPFIRQQRADGQVVLHEFDDDFWDLPMDNPSSTLYTRVSDNTKNFEAICRECDGLIVSTPYLARKVAHLHPNIWVCPNAVDDAQAVRRAPSVFPEEPRRFGEFRIGWAGSDTHRGDFREFRPALARFMRRHPEVRFVSIGADMRDQVPEDIRWRAEFLGRTVTEPTKSPEDLDEHDLASVRYYDLLERAMLDVAVAPLRHNEFNRSKSYVKAIEYGMLGIPAVLQGFGPYADYVKGGGVALVARSSDEWFEALEDLYGNASRRAEMAVGNLSHVLREHVASRTRAFWATAIESALALKETAA